MRAAMLAGSLVAVAVATGAGAMAQEVNLPDSLPPGVTAAMVERGKVVFEVDGMCASCHGTQAAAKIGPNLTDSEWWHAKGSYLEIVSQILSGVPAERSRSGVAMAARGGSSISDSDVQAVAAYIWSLSHPEAGDSLPAGVSRAMVERGAAVFAGPGRCANCHGAEAGGGIGPDLTDEDWLHAKGSYISILTQVLIGVPADKSRSGLPMLPRGGASLSDDDAHAVAAYVWVLSRMKR